MSSSSRGEIEGLNDFLRLCRKAGPEVQEAMRVAAIQVAEKMARYIKLRGVAAGPQTALATQTVRAVRDRIPVVRLGGPTKVTRADGSRVNGGAVYFGADFGSKSGMRQFPKANPKEGRVLWPTVRAKRAAITEEFFDRMEQIAKQAFPD